MIGLDAMQVVSPDGQSLGKVTSRKTLDAVGDSGQAMFFSEEELFDNVDSLLA